MTILVKQQAQRNRTLRLTAEDIERLQPQLRRWSLPETPAPETPAPESPAPESPAPETLENCILHQDLFTVLPNLHRGVVDLLFLDPPYNLTKSFNGHCFRARSPSDYTDWLNTWLPQLLPTLKPTASVYVCGDWRSSGALQQVLSQHLIIRNRITWEREKGRGAKGNWKNCSEDIWFCTASKQYTFNGEAVRLKRRVQAPYRTVGSSGQREPKDWLETLRGNFRLTSASNLWTDLTVPFWSMSENTEHPTQKPEKLLAKLILASSNPGDLVLDPFLGSGTTAVVAKKLGRRFVGIEQDLMYCCLALKRLHLADNNPAIQGYVDQIFWDRNSQ